MYTFLRYNRISAYRRVAQPYNSGLSHNFKRRLSSDNKKKSNNANSEVSGIEKHSGVEDKPLHKDSTNAGDRMVGNVSHLTNLKRSYKFKQNNVSSSELLSSVNLVLAHNTSSAISQFQFPSHSGSKPSLLRCILFDKEGRHRIMSTDAQKTQLLLKHDLLPRDLRKIDKGYDDIVPLIVIREKSILVSILHIKALIKSDSVVLFNYDGTYSDNKLISNMTEKLRNVQDDKLDYEIRALETIFANVIDNLMIEMQIHVTVVNGILKELENDIDLAKLKYLLIVSKKLGQFSQKATLIRDLIDEMLDHDEELSEMYLTEKKHGTHRSKDDHQEVELILESYSLHCDAIVQTIESRVNDVRTTEEIINIILDSNRNDLMLLNLNLSITLMCLAGILFVGAAYGMNLENFIEEKNLWFYIVIGGSTVFGILLFRLANKRLTQLQKIQLSNR